MDAQLRHAPHNGKGAGAVPSSRREEILKRDRNRCQYCGLPGHTLDHIIPRSVGGSNNPDNLLACCHGCNQRKGNQRLGPLAHALAELIKAGKTTNRGHPILIVQALVAGHEPPPFVERSSLIEENIKAVNLALDVFLSRGATRIHRNTVLKHPRKLELLEGMVLLAAAGLSKQTAHYWTIPRGRTLARYQRIQQAREVLETLEEAVPKKQQHIHTKHVKKALAQALPDVEPAKRGLIFTTLARSGVLLHKRNSRKGRDGYALLTRKHAYFNRERLHHLGTVTAVAQILSSP